METPEYEGIVIVGGDDQTITTSALPDSMISRQSGTVKLIHRKPDGSPHNISSLTGATYKAVPYESGETPTSLASGVVGYTPEIFTLTTGATPDTSGTFTLRVAGETTSAIAYNADASTIQTALEALASRTGGDFNVSIVAGENLGYALASVRVETSGGFAIGWDSTIDGSSLPLSSITLEVTQQGSAIQNEYSATWSKDSIPASFSDYVFDRSGAIAFFAALEDADDFYQSYQRINIEDDGFINTGGSVPSSATYVYNPADNNDWLRISESAPTQIGEGLDKEAAKNFRDFGTVLDIIDTPVVSPNDGEAWLVASSGATGDFTGKENKIAKWSSTLSAYSFSNVHKDWDEVRNEDDGELYRYNSSGPSWDQVVITITSSNISDFDSAVSSNSAVALNTAKVSNETHTGEVTGATTLTMSSTAITNKTEVTAEAGDYILISDDSDSGNLKKVDASDFLAGAGDVVGPASSTDDNIATFDGATGKLIQDGGSTISDVLDRANMTGTQTASTISDFDTEVSNNSAVVLNTAKVSNETHTGDVTGSIALTLESVAITGQTAATPVSGDKFLFSDTSDSGNLKECDFDDIGGGGGSGDVVGPASSVDDRIATFDGVTGKLIQDGGNTISEIANATHTGDVTGATVLTIDPTAITNKTEVTPVAGDFLLFSDTSDSGALKKVDADDFLSGGGFPSARVTGLSTTGTVDIDWSTGGTFVVGTMTGNITFTFSNVTQGQPIIIEITGDSGYDVTLPASASSGWSSTSFTVDEVNYLSLVAINGSTEQAYIYSTTSAATSSSEWTFTSTSATATAGGKYILSGSSTVLTFPSAPADGSEILVSRNDADDAPEVARGGSDTIEDVTTNMALEVDKGTTRFVYDSGNTNWIGFNLFSV